MFGCYFILGQAGSSVTILLDESLDEYETVYPAAGTSATGVPISPKYYEEITGGIKVMVT